MVQAFEGMLERCRAAATSTVSVAVGCHGDDMSNYMSGSNKEPPWAFPLPACLLRQILIIHRVQMQCVHDSMWTVIMNLSNVVW